MESIQKIELSNEQFKQIKRELAELVMPPKEFMTIDELANYLSLSKSAIYKLTSNKEIPFYTPGGKKIYFRKIEINEWLERSRVATHYETLRLVESSIDNLQKSGL